MVKIEDLASEIVWLKPKNSLIKNDENPKSKNNFSDKNN
jgi:hypothetical protein